MIENHPQEALLIRYADGCSTPAEDLKVKELIEHDKSAAEFLQQLESTQGWLKAASAIETNQAPVKISNYVHDYKTSDARKHSHNNPINRLAIAATLLIGLIGGALIGANYQPSGSSDKLVVSEPPEWVRLVADYHRLYDRETVSDGPALAVNNTSAELSTKLKRTVTVPDLNEFAMEFKREQSLSYSGQPIVQLVYLPEHSRPVAVCILTSKDTAEFPAVSGTHENMRYAYWQDSYHAVVIVADLPSKEMQALVKEVQSTLFAT